MSTSQIVKPELKTVTESIKCYECRASSTLQERGHVGVTGPFVGFRRYEADDWDGVLAFIEKHKDQPYCCVDCIIDIKEEYHTHRVYTVRYHDVFLKDDSLLE